MAEDSGSEQEVKKKVVVEHSTRDTSKSMIIPLVVIGIIVAALLIYILTRLD